MKLTDMAIIFQLFFICLMTVAGYRDSYLHGESMNEVMFNNVMDGIVEDSLMAGYKSVDDNGRPIVDLYEVTRCFEAENALYSSSNMQLLIYVREDGFQIWDCGETGQWSELIVFSDGERTLHEIKVMELTEYLQYIYGFNVSIPFNDGEAWGNTIDAYSLLAISVNSYYDITSFSGAKLHRTK